MHEESKVTDPHFIASLTHPSSRLMAVFQRARASVSVAEVKTITFECPTGKEAGKAIGSRPNVDGTGVGRSGGALWSGTNKN